MDRAAFRRTGEARSSDTPPRPPGYGQHDAISGVGDPRRSYGYVLGTPP
jgi:hypothetical protein